LQYFCEVDIEEVDVQACLDNASCHSYGVHDAFGEISVNPIRDVECPIQAQGSEIMCRNRLRLSSALEHEQLWEDCDGLKPDGEGPEDLGEVELVVEYEGEDKAGCEEIFDFEGVNGRVMRWSVFELHEIENVAAAADEEELHDRVVYRHEAEEQVEVTRYEYRHVEHLRFERYAST